MFQKTHKKRVTRTLTKDRRFGTDGIRGPVDSTMNPLFVTKLGWAAGSVLKEEGVSRVLIGKDTRISGYMLESALQAGFISSGMDVTLLGPLPTPAVAYLAKKNKQAGVVISASHNLFEGAESLFFPRVKIFIPVQRNVFFQNFHGFLYRKRFHGSIFARDRFRHKERINNSFFCRFYCGHKQTIHVAIANIFP